MCVLFRFRLCLGYYTTLYLYSCLLYPLGPGHFPPMMHRHANPEARNQRAASAGYSRAHNSEAVAKAKGGGTGAGTGGKSNLAGHIIPVYGFGILLYILYILFKVIIQNPNALSRIVI